ncbi:hypothetical protein FIBSPDRAFT_1038027 [Athelia psychrophila]|uniref:NB-ARC domain-containing protein n=1 Tax=Athelia psychrophila TaxID=1759441 RepID=A0A166TMC8_9AGAM|nr:hypothetical protein FIBSPDRAFT_1038027 [Fibularhizoctonia sp. CBS 109695]
MQKRGVARDVTKTPPVSASWLEKAGPSFYTSHTIGGNIFNVAGDYHTENPTVTYPPDRANHAPTGAITRHFVGRADELLQTRRAFDSPREDNRPVRYALWGAAGIGKSQLALQYAERAYAQGRYSHVFHISASSTDHIRRGLAHILRLVQPSDYACAASIEAQEARRWLEDTHPDVLWLLIVDSAVLDSVNYLRTHLPRRNQGGDILFVAQSEAVAKALADESHGTVLEVGPLAQDDAVQLLFKKAGAEESTESIGEAKLIVEQLDRLPVPICQAASFAKHFQGDLACLTRLLQEGRGAALSRWDTRLTGYEHTTFESMVQAQFARLVSDRPQAAELLKVLCYLHPNGISLPILVDGARLLLSPATKTSKLSRFMSQLRRPSLSPPDLCHRLRALLSVISLQDELHSLVRCLQHISLVRIETVHCPTNGERNVQTLENRSSHTLHIPDLVRKIVSGSIVQIAEESAYYDIAVRIVASAFVHHKHDPSLWRPFIKHIVSLSRWGLRLKVPRRSLSLIDGGLLFYATQIIIDFHGKVGLEGKLKTMKLEFDGDFKLVLNLQGLHTIRQLKQATFITPNLARPSGVYDAQRG